MGSRHILATRPLRWMVAKGPKPRRTPARLLSLLLAGEDPRSTSAPRPSLTER